MNALVASHCSYGCTACESSVHSVVPILSFIFDVALHEAPANKIILNKRILRIIYSSVAIKLQASRCIAK